MSNKKSNNSSTKFQFYPQDLKIREFSRTNKKYSDEIENEKNNKNNVTESSKLKYRVLDEHLENNKMVEVKDSNDNKINSKSKTVEKMKDEINYNLGLGKKDSEDDVRIEAIDDNNNKLNNVVSKNDGHNDSLKSDDIKIGEKNFDVEKHLSYNTNADDHANQNPTNEQN
jgi:hypothetical protein